MDDTLYDKKRWIYRSQFPLACFGYAGGIGNIVRFPSLCYKNGGGSFLIPYFLTHFIIGVPLFALEALLGQFSSFGAMRIYRMCPIFKGTGYGQIASNIMCVCYYSVISAYPLIYLGASSRAKLPWIDCNNTWNTPKCVDLAHLRNKFKNADVKQLITPANEYYHLEVLQVSSSVNEFGSIVWPLFLSLFLLWFLLFLCVLKGIRSMGSIMYFMAIFPYLILFSLLIRSITLDGAAKGIMFYLTPDWAKLRDLRTWLEACLDTLLCLGPGWGGIINLARFNQFNHNAIIDSIFVPCIHICTSLLSGFIVFSVLGYLSVTSGLEIDQISEGGAALSFITYPEVIAKMPASNLWSFLFFFMLVLLGLQNVFPQLEGVIDCIIDEIQFLQTPNRKIYTTIVMCIILFFISSSLVFNSGIYMISLIKFYAVIIPIFVFMLVINVVIVYIYSLKKIMIDYIFIFGNHRGIFIWKFLWGLVTPTFLITVLIGFFTLHKKPGDYYSTEDPVWAISVAWILTLIPVSFILLYAIYYTIVYKTWKWKNFKLAFSATNWYPADLDIRAEYIQFKANLKTGEKYPKLPRRKRT